MNFKALIYNNYIAINTLLLLSLLVGLCLYFFGWIFIVLTGTTFLVLYISAILCFRFSHALQRSLVFQPKAKMSPDMDFNELCRNFARTRCRNCYIPRDGIPTYIGFWHIRPIDEEFDLIGDLDSWGYDFYLEHSNRDVIIYFHGNTGTRALDHRMELYKLLVQNLGYHVIAFDYRGFADSARTTLSEESVVDDGICVFNWIRRIVGPERNIIIWGHSLGSGIASHAVHKICASIPNPPIRLILESPFTNIGECTQNHRLAKMFAWLPHFNEIFIHSLHKNGIAFRTDEYIKTIPIGILILHAEDDETIPIFLGRRLANIVLAHRSSSLPDVTAHWLGVGYGHKGIYKAPDLLHVIREFITKPVHIQNP